MLLSFYLSHFVLMDTFVFLTLAVELFFNWYAGSEIYFQSFVFVFKEDTVIT